MTSRTPSRLANRRVVSRRLYGIGEVLRTLTKDLFDPSRPERHYMRGPGPKWQEKNAARSVQIGRAKLAVVRSLVRQPR